MADIPGLIEGAHEGAGLGTRFLGHVERCRALLHLVDGTQDDVVGAYRTVRAELKAYGGNLARKKEIVALNKIDAMTRGGHRGQARAAGQGEPQGGARDLRRLRPRRAAAAARAAEAGREAARPGQRKPAMSAPLAPLEGARRLVVKIGSSILVDETKGEIRRDWLESPDRRRRAPAQGRLRGRAGLLRRHPPRPHAPQAGARPAQARGEARPPPPPARSSSPTPTRRRWRATASPWRRSC